MKTSIPQGSIPRPLLFLVLENDIISHVDDMFLTLFAGDTTAVNSAHNDISLRNLGGKCFQDMATICRGNGLVLNRRKTKCMIFFSNGKPYMTTVCFLKQIACVCSSETT